jgi:hypothetical protein
MNETDINDKRSQTEFKGVSFSKFQKSKVKTELINCLINAKIEPACYWSAELVCAGHFSDLWETIILFVSRYIHLGNPKLPIYISLRFSNFKDIVCGGYADNEIRLRNNPKIRQIFAEVIGALCFSRKKHSFVPLKIKKEEEYSMTHMASRLKAPSITYAGEVFRADDPKEFYIAINEFTYHISSESRNVVNACYWLEWVLEFDAICKKSKDINSQKQQECETRTFAPVLSKYQKDTIWIIWDAILQAAKKQGDALIIKIVNALLEMFSIKFMPGVKKRRKFIIYFAIALLTEPVDLTMEMIHNHMGIENVKKKIGIVYKDIKKNEVSPDTDYLFNGMRPEQSSLDKTIEQLEKMNDIMGGGGTKAL